MRGILDIVILEVFCGPDIPQRGDNIDKDTMHEVNSEAAREVEGW